MVKYRIGWSWNSHAGSYPDVYFSLDTVRRELAYKNRSKPKGMVLRVEEKRNRNSTWHYINVSDE